MLTPWKESYDQPRKHIKKQRHYFANKCLSSHGYGFSSGHVWMWELDCEESWAPKNWRFWTSVLEKTLESPLDCKERSNQSILKEISPGCSLDGLMLKLKLQYFGHLMRTVDSLEKTLMLGGIGGRRRRGWQRMRWLDDILTWWEWVWVNSKSWWWTGRPGMLRFMGLQRVGHDWVTDLNQLNAWKIRSQCWLSKMHNMKVESFLGGKNEDCSPGDSTSDTSEKLFQRGTEQHMWFCWRESTRNPVTIFLHKFSVNVMKVSWSHKKQSSPWRCALF